MTLNHQMQKMTPMMTDPASSMHVVSVVSFKLCHHLVDI